jgi:hypothetical protein
VAFLQINLLRFPIQAEAGITSFGRSVEHGEPSDGGEDGLFAGLADVSADLRNIWVDFILGQDAVDNLRDADAVVLATLESLSDDGENLEAVRGLNRIDISQQCEEGM